MSRRVIPLSACNRKQIVRFLPSSDAPESLRFLSELVPSMVDHKISTDRVETGGADSLLRTARSGVFVNRTNAGAYGSQKPATVGLFWWPATIDSLAPL